MESRAFPGAKGFPVIGLSHKLKGNLLAFCENYWKEYGDCVSLDLGIYNLFLVVHPDDVLHILQTNGKNYLKGYQEFVDLLGTGLLLSDGDFWLKQRKFIQPFFTRQKIRNYFEIIRDAGEAYCERLKGKDRVDITEEMTQLAQDVLANTVFQTSMGETEQLLCDTIYKALQCIDKRMFMPGFLRKVPFKVNREYDRALADIDEIIPELIKSREANNLEGEDLLTLFLRENPNGEGPMPYKHIRDELTTLFFAGHETTANALSWVWYALSQNQDARDKMVEEVKQVCGKERLSFEKLFDLKYTRQVFEETLRMYPPAWMFPRISIKEDVLPSGFIVPPETDVVFSPYLTQKHPDFWKDPHIFDPDRFSPEQVEKRHKAAYFPFGLGQRQCIGSHFSLIESLTLMALLSQHFLFDFAGDTHPIKKPTVTMRPTPAVQMTVQHCS